MKYTDVAETYDKLFKDNASPQIWENVDRRPIPLIEALENFVTSGDVLDIGAGVGHNSVYLASRGFNVLATDISAVAIERLGARAKARAVSIRTRIHDIADEELENDFDVIICTDVLHHLQTDDALSVIKKIQEHTKPLGFNIIRSFTKRGSFYSKNPETKNVFLDSNEELSRLYSKWTIHISFEKNGPACQKGYGGETLFNVFAGLLSQKT
jgi:2-polyprenyl-3-methyl-5-hydroxy-6-metoxy-1,4-benzoquinol methylase